MAVRFAGPLLTLMFAWGVEGVAAADPGPPRVRGTVASELARLDAELKDQRQILMQLMAVEQQHYDLLLKLIQSNGVHAPPSQPGAASTTRHGATAVAATTRAELSRMAVAGSAERGGLAGDGRRVEGSTPASNRSTAPERTATVTGKVEMPSGAAVEVYVFAQNVNTPAVRGRTIEVSQRDKQFVPAVAVVQRGTKVTFPNYDALFHNVFSPGPPHAFDLGSYRSGESPRAVEMTSVGVVDIFCNMHAKMHATILVVPSPVWTRVAPDGTFRLENVPLGTRKLVAWSPRTRPVEQTVQVNAAGAVTEFTLTLAPPRPHNNKHGLPYGSYKD